MKGAQLKKARERMGMTAVQLAAALDMHPVSISRFEHDDKPIPKVVVLAVEALENRAKKKPNK